jgi:hypothetical protein
MRLDSTIKREGQAHLRYVLDNPDPAQNHDPRFSLDCPAYSED